MIPTHTGRNNRAESIVVGIARTARVGWTLGFDVFYNSAGTSYHMRTQTRVLLAARVPLCDPVLRELGF